MRNLKIIAIITEMDKISGGAHLEKIWILRKIFTWHTLSLRPSRGDTRVANVKLKGKVTKFLQV